MFIYCGMYDNNRLRILDTEDGVVQTVSPLELKAVQAQGYSVKKDFSYDYAYEFYQKWVYLWEIRTNLQIQVRRLLGIAKEDGRYLRIMQDLYKISKKFGLDIGEYAIECSDFRTAYLCKNVGFVGAYISKLDSNRYRIYTLVAGINGVFFKHKDIELTSALSPKLALRYYSYHDTFLVLSMHNEYYNTEALFINMDFYGNILKVKEGEQ